MCDDVLFKYYSKYITKQVIQSSCLVYFCTKRTVSDNYFTFYHKLCNICGGNMTQHDKHQYYFEKYLRNDMPEDEREVFEQKLAADASLRMAFEYYKLNRQKLLEQLIEEHQLSRRDNRLNKLIFLLISLTGIVLV